MKKAITIILFTGIQILGFSQKNFQPDLSGFSKSTLKKARTNAEVTFMTEEEKKIVFYTNLVRMEPQVFLERIVKPYVRINYPFTNYYVKTLISDLKKALHVNPLIMKKDLYMMSRNHQVDIGKNGIQGHKGSKGKTFAKRAKPLLQTYNGVSENIGLGYATPIENVLELLIDDGVVSLGHRETLLSSRYNCVGVALGSHTTYRIGCVMDFGVNKPF